jgi:methionyl-tRNA synthetase
MKDGYYVTTPIYYVNDVPHIGHAYTTIAADVLARYHRQQGRDVYFQTGTDEHGVNVRRAAEAHGAAPAAYAATVAQAFRDLWQRLDVSHDRFIRTTEDDHARAALELWRRIEARGDFYRGVYEGAYCAKCEAYYQADDLRDDGTCPVHRTAPEHLREENTFFRLSRYQEPLQRLVAETDFVQPAARRNEVLGWLRQGLRDFSVTRANVHWGIPAPGAPGEVLYVWIDALANYLTGAGFPVDAERLARYWPADVHLIGTEITRFHCLYWPALLLSAELPLPRRVFAHGWLTNDGQKISKSTGNAIDPAALAGEFGPDALRYFLVRAIPFGQDGDYTRAAVVARYNADLANNFGNLVQRAVNLIERFAGGRVPVGVEEGPDERPLRAAGHDLPVRVAEAFERLALDEAAAAVLAFVGEANRYVESQAPWHLAQSGWTVRVETIVYHVWEAARLAAWHLWPFVPRGAAEAHRRLSGLAPLPGLSTFGAAIGGGTVRAGEPLYPRVKDTAPYGRP